MFPSRESRVVGFSMFLFCFCLRYTEHSSAAADVKGSRVCLGRNWWRWWRTNTAVRPPSMAGYMLAVLCCDIFNVSCCASERFSSSFLAPIRTCTGRLVDWHIRLCSNGMATLNISRGFSSSSEKTLWDGHLKNYTKISNWEHIKLK